MIPLIREKTTDIGNLCQRFGVQRLELFGSATSSRFDPAKSDLDFLVRFQPTEFGQRAENYFGLLFAFEELFERPVDLLERDAVHNPYFIQAVEPTRQVLYAA